MTERLVDPYGVAFQSGHWYLVSWDHFRGAMRTFRLDRMLATEATTEMFEPPDDFDAVAYVRQSIGEAVYGTRCEVVLALTFDEAKRRVSPTDGTLEQTADGTVLRFSADDFDWAASFLASLECDLVVLRPPELRTSLRKIAARLQAAGRRPVKSRAGPTRHVVRQPRHGCHTSEWCPAMSPDQTHAMTFSALAAHLTTEPALHRR